MNEKVTPAIAIRSVTFGFTEEPVLEDIFLDIAPKDFIGIVGPNGSGKTTLLKLILGLYTPDKGFVEVLGKTPEKARPNLGYVPQFTNFDRHFPVTVLDAVMMGRLSSTRTFGPFTASDKERAQDALRTVGSEHLGKRLIGRLSGGQLQRVLLARALVSAPSILLLDEPTANIDVKAEESFFDLLQRLNDRVTIALVSHDIGFITSHVNRVACVNRTLVCHPTTKISSETIAAMYERPVEAIEHSRKISGQKHG
ncbi:MAG: ABC transporter ATP-binding protein [Candidatus Pacebacteria bacterium]|nr:ABC transporter ATP-binding protein [Candidatus Paceibacterota bacterium]